MQFQAHEAGAGHIIRPRCFGAVSDDAWLAHVPVPGPVYTTGRYRSITYMQCIETDCRPWCGSISSSEPGFGPGQQTRVVVVVGLCFFFIDFFASFGVNVSYKAVKLFDEPLVMRSWHGEVSYAVGWAAAALTSSFAPPTFPCPTKFDDFSSLFDSDGNVPCYSRKDDYIQCFQSFIETFLPLIIDHCAILLHQLFLKSPSNGSYYNITHPIFHTGLNL